MSKAYINIHVQHTVRDRLKILSNIIFNFRCDPTKDQVKPGMYILVYTTLVKLSLRIWLIAIDHGLVDLFTDVIDLHWLIEQYDSCCDDLSINLFIYMYLLIYLLSNHIHVFAPKWSGRSSVKMKKKINR